MKTKENIFVEIAKFVLMSTGDVIAKDALKNERRHTNFELVYAKFSGIKLFLGSLPGYEPYSHTHTNRTSDL